MKRETDPLRILDRANQFADRKNQTIFGKMQDSKALKSVDQVSIELIDARANPRKKFEPETLKELASTMSSIGLLQPIIIRGKGNRFELIAGERRLRAAKILGWKSIPAIVKDVEEIPTDQVSSAKILENLQREDLTKEELSLAILELVDKGMTQIEVAKILGKSKQWVSQKVQHAGLIKEVPKAGQLDSTTAARIFSQDRKQWKQLVETAIAAPKAREFVTSQLPKAKSNKPHKESIETMKKRIEKINERIFELQKEKQLLQERIKEAKKGN